MYINPIKLSAEYKGTIYRHQAFVVQAKGWQANIDSLTNELDTAPPSQAAVKQQQLDQYRQALQQKAQAEQEKMNQEVLAEINAYIKQYGKEKGYDFILGATDNGNIVYAAEGKDITDEVLAGLNAQYDQQHSTRK